MDCYHSGKPVLLLFHYRRRIVMMGDISRHCGGAGQSMKTNENQWKSMKINENQWKSMKNNENQWKSMKFDNFLIFLRPKLLLTWPACHPHDMPPSSNALIMDFQRSLRHNKPTISQEIVKLWNSNIFMILYFFVLQKEV